MQDIQYDDPQDVTISLEEPMGADGEERFEYDEDSPNLAVDFCAHPDGKEALRKIAERVKVDFDDAWEGSRNYRERLASDYLLFSGDLPPKEYPYKGAANPHIPIMLENITRLSFRASSELFGDFKSFFGVVPMGPEDEETAALLSKHGNWQLRNQITDFKRQMARAMLFFFGIGDVTCHSYRDPVRQRNKHDVLTPDEFVVPRSMVSTEPDYSDLPFYCRVLHYQRHELQQMRDIWYDVDKVLKNDADPNSEPDAPMNEAAAQFQGIDETQQAKRAPYKLIQFEGYLDSIPNQPDDRFVKVIMDYSSKHVLHMSFHEEDDWQDRLRFDRETAELAQYRGQKDQWDAGMKALSDRETELEAVRGAAVSNEYERADAGAKLIGMRTEDMPPAPVAPSWMQDPNNPLEEPFPARKVPIRMFAHGVCIEPLTGTLGLGYGRILGDMNRVANVTTAQFLDAAHLANSGSIITPANFVFEGAFEVRPGKHNKVKGMSGSEIKDSIVQLTFPPANPQLLGFAQWTTELAQSSVQAPDVLSGEAGKSGETFRGISSRIDQATKQLSVSTTRFADFTTQVLKNNAKLNALFLNEEEMFNFVDEATKTATSFTVRRDMYNRDYAVEYTSDLKFTSEAARVGQADEILQMPNVAPMLGENMAFMYHAIKRSLEARGRADMVPLLGPAPEAPTGPMALPQPPGAQVDPLTGMPLPPQQVAA
jgi:hypothetical protein